MLVAAGELHLALQDYKDALLLEPSNAEAAFRLASTYEVLGQLQQVLTHLLANSRPIPPQDVALDAAEVF